MAVANGRLNQLLLQLEHLLDVAAAWNPAMNGKYAFEMLSVLSANQQKNTPGLQRARSDTRWDIMISHGEISLQTPKQDLGAGNACAQLTIRSSYMWSQKTSGVYRCKRKYKQRNGC